MNPLMVRPWMGEVDLTDKGRRRRKRGRKGDTDRCNLPSDFPLNCRHTVCSLATAAPVIDDYHLAERY